MPKLVFHPCNPEYDPKNIDNIVTALQEIGFLGEKWQSPKTVLGERYLIGDSFLSLVTFLGCAPAIELAPIADKPESTEFCHIEIEPVKKEIEFIRGSEHLISRCPHCRQRHASWESIPESLSYSCDKCEVETHLSKYDWKNMAGCGRFFYKFAWYISARSYSNIQLLLSLEKISDTKWNYFYIQ